MSKPVPALLLLCALLAACSTTRTGGEIKSVNSAKTITASEWASFAEAMKESIVQTGVVDRYRGPDGGPVVVVVGDFANDTNRPDFARTKDVMYNEIRKTLVNTGKIAVNMDFAGSGGSADSIVQQIAQLRASGEYDASTVPEAGRKQAPRLILNGQFVNIEFEEGRTKQYDYACAVRLIDVEKGYSVWEDQVIFPKQFTRGIFGS